MNALEQLLLNLNNSGLFEPHTEFKRNSFLKVAGSRDSNIYFIESGLVRAYVLDENEEHTIRFGYAGSIITALDSFFRDQPSPLYLQALKASQVRVLKKERFQHFIEHDQDSQTLWNTVLGELAVQQLEREIDLLTKSPQERIERVMKRSPQLFQKVPHKYIANYLRMTPETLSRIKAP